jgi:predicted metal-dependent HD superfamily phosphohydrolase
MSRYTQDRAVSKKFYSELVKSYSERGRHYHNLNHLESLLQQILPIADQLRDLDTVLFALYYHDVVYHVLRKDNEERSARLAQKRLTILNFDSNRIEICKQHILATKTHGLSNDSDTNFFVDADLSILGQDSLTYKRYAEGVRKEYSIYPDIIYKPGRKKVLTHFLQMEKIFKTESFFARFESQARINLKTELEALLM